MATDPTSKATMPSFLGLIQHAAVKNELGEKNPLCPDVMSTGPTQSQGSAYPINLPLSRLKPGCLAKFLAIGVVESFMGNNQQNFRSAL